MKHNTTINYDNLFSGLGGLNKNLMTTSTNSSEENIDELVSLLLEKLLASTSKGKSSNKPLAQFNKCNITFNCQITHLNGDKNKVKCYTSKPKDGKSKSILFKIISYFLGKIFNDDSNDESLFIKIHLIKAGKKLPTFYFKNYHIFYLCNLASSYDIQDSLLQHQKLQSYQY